MSRSWALNLRAGNLRAGLAVCVGLACSACTGVTPIESHPVDVRRKDQKVAAPQVVASDELGPPDLAKAKAKMAKGSYRTAEQELLLVIEQQPEAKPHAEVALAEIEAMTGRGDSALTHSRPHCRAGGIAADEACRVTAEVLRRQGQLDAALDVLATFADARGSRRLRLALADLLMDRGRLTEARVQYRRLVDDFAQSLIGVEDAAELAITGRAAHRMGAWREANEFFNRAEMTGVADLTALLWRGELYLDAHDPGHARAVADEALRFAPDHPSALLLAARVRLSAVEDGEQAERYLQRVLTIDPARADAHAILGGLALRDLDFERVHSHIEKGLLNEPKHLELLSLRAAARFLADEDRAFDAAVFEVLTQNPSHARVYRLVAEYAESEHRYNDTIPLLRRAIELDPDDAIVRAQLGIQLLRAGDEAEGRQHLSRAFARDPFDLRVKNTLLLYERQIDKEYSTLRHGHFSIRLPNAYREVLKDLVPGWLDAAHGVLQNHYGRPKLSRVAVELYADQDSFGVRTSGVPATFLQGVCFGRTIVARLPTDEPTNLGMTLWHELSHVYHLELSKHRVPRWFTEGLAEVETARRRPEWSREQDLAVYEAVRQGRLPSVERMNRAFSHAATLDDLGVAYVASTYLVDFLLRTYGQDRMTKMLKAWGQRRTTEEVVASVLETDLDRLDVAFRESLRQRFAHFEKQYVPREQLLSVEAARAKVAAHPEDPTARAALAHAELRLGKLAAARDAIAQAAAGVANHADLLWVSSMVSLADQQVAPAEEALRKLLTTGQDGYFVRMQLALLARMKSDPVAEKAALERAYQFHRTGSEPLYRLAAIARESGDRSAEYAALSSLALLEEADVGVHRRVVELALELGKNKDAAAAAERLGYVNPLSVDVHTLRARVSLANRDARGAQRELGLARRLSSPGREREAIERLLADVVAGRATPRAKSGN